MRKCINRDLTFELQWLQIKTKSIFAQASIRCQFKNFRNGKKNEIHMIKQTKQTKTLLKTN